MATTNEQLVTLTCDHCGEEAQVKIETLRLNRTVACLACGVSLDYNPAKFRPVQG